MAHTLFDCPSALVQEPLLIAMIRLRAECNEVPANVVEVVNELSQSKQRATRLVYYLLLGIQIALINFRSAL